MAAVRSISAGPRRNDIATRLLSPFKTAQSVVIPQPTEALPSRTSYLGRRELCLTRDSFNFQPSSPSSARSRTGRRLFRGGQNANPVPISLRTQVGIVGAGPAG